MVKYRELKNRISHNYNKLPKNHKTIADYFIENFDRIPFMSVHQIAKNTSKSVASIVRFTQRLGFNGYSELREAISQTLQQRLASNKVFPGIDNQQSEDHLITSVANQDIKNISETYNLIDQAIFDKVVDLITKAKNIFTVGLGISHLMAQILSYQLNKIGLNSQPFRHDYVSFLDQTLLLNKDDLIICFSFPPYSRETIEVAQAVRRKKIDVISITNRSAAPITFHSTYSLIVRSENVLFTNSFTGIAFIINALVTECTLRDKTRAEKTLKALNQFAELSNEIIFK